MFPSPYSKTYQVLGLKRHCFCPWCISPNLSEIKLLCTVVQVGEETLQKEMYCIESKRVWVTSDILQTAVWPYRDSKSPARGKPFYKCEPVFPWKL